MRSLAEETPQDEPERDRHEPDHEDHIDHGLALLAKRVQSHGAMVGPDRRAAIPSGSGPGSFGLADGLTTGQYVVPGEPSRGLFNNVPRCHT